MKAIILFLIRSYKIILSPFLPRACIYSPTCSEYAKEAVLRYGTWKGIFLSFKRVLRCHPFASGGYDPVV
ncbi:MAG: membrane protein insertion efficiency factor YidD [Elusimicrobia bacterium RIFOXYB2_FULL_49_7]|nr:MAG: membrane protein insertion efficiency factor YidD [Elusimicrobia bacterium RIFOXYB2_FULL_49_7]